MFVLGADMTLYRFQSQEKGMKLQSHLLLSSY
jgi:hypothetical protein